MSGSISDLLKQLDKYGHIVIGENLYGPHWNNYAEQIITLLRSRNIIVNWYKDSVSIKTIQQNQGFQNSF